jgi:hypothetical protein
LSRRAQRRARCQWRLGQDDDSPKYSPPRRPRRPSSSYVSAIVRVPG